MRRLLHWLGVLLLACSSADSAGAQFFDKLTNPQITVTLTHPPGLGLKVSRVAIAQAIGEKADQVSDAITGDFVSSGMEVMDRQHLQSTLAEHQFNLTGYVDPQTAMRLGKFLGSTALLFINVQRGATERTKLREYVQDSRRVQHVRWISQTRAFLKVSVQTVDLTTGRTFQAKVFEAAPKQQTYSIDECCAEFPSEFAVLDEGIQQIVSQVHAQFLSWSEQRKVFFFDDKDCQLKVAYSLLKGGDIAGAATQSMQNVEVCKSLPKPDDKKLAHSLYNVGMTAFLLDDHAKALDYFSQAQRVKDMGITTEAMAEVTKAANLAAESRRVEERTRIAAEQAQAAAAVPPPPPVVTPVPASASRPTGISVRASTASGAKSSPAAGKKGQSTPADRLRKLNDLFKQDLITKAEFEKKKAEILKDM